MQIPQSSFASLNNHSIIPKQHKEGLPKEITPSKLQLKEVQEHEFTDEKVKKVKVALNSFNEMLKPTHLEFQMHDDAGRYFVKIVIDKTQEVIKQIPSEEVLEMIGEAKEQLGLLVDKRV